MKQMFAIALRATLVTLLVTGVVYPLLVTGLAQVLFPSRANGSMVTDQGREVGSSLIGQSFKDPAYLQGRPSAAGDAGYDGTASQGTNLGTTSKKLRDTVALRVAALRAANPGAGPIPIDLVTSSASGLDPHISPEAAHWQVARIAKARDVAIERVRTVIDEHTEGRELGLLGEPRVNVLGVNLALDRLFGRPPQLATGGTMPK
jgi:K+-transporting ATPase ATPase C chain